MQKPIIYAEIPEFDQSTQAVYQTEPKDEGDHIYIGITVIDLPLSESDMTVPTPQEESNE